MWFDHHGAWWHGWPMMWLWIIVAVVVVWILVRYLRPDGGVPGTGRPPGRLEDPLEILRRRYAAGEIDDAEFERRRRHLGEPAGNAERSEDGKRDTNDS